MAVSIRGSGVAIDGGAELDRMLKGLGGKAGKAIVRKAVTAGGNIVKAAVEQNAPSMVGGEMGRLIGRNIQVRAYRRQRSGSYARFLSIKANVPEFDHVTASGTRHYIPADIEFGHDDVAPIPFMRRSAESTKKRAETRVFRLIQADVLRYARQNTA